ncbi:hypothetical protein BGZ79_002964 [Entomortierella chlamydospora]|nr:hypothetical protein BGZ79_002964 [Entomortierella chlamydospora]
MRVHGLWRLVGDVHQAPKVNLPSDTILLVDLFGACFCSVRYNFFALDNNEWVYNSIDKFLRSRFANKAKVEIYIDGGRTKEKEKTTKARLATAKRQFKAAEAIIEDIESKVDGGETVTSATHKRCSRYLLQSFSLTTADRRSLANGLKSLGWVAVMAKGEAGLAIRARCEELKQQNIRFAVVTSDSGLLAHEAVPMVYRPIRRGFLQYDVDQCAVDLGVSRRQLTALAIVSRNDYSRGTFCLDISINIEIIKGLATPSTSCCVLILSFASIIQENNLTLFIIHSTIEKSVSNIVDDYLKSVTIKSRFKKEDLYQSSRKVFLSGSETLIDSRESSEDAEIHKAAKALSLRYKNAKAAMIANSKAKREE